MEEEAAKFARQVEDQAEIARCSAGAEELRGWLEDEPPEFGRFAAAQYLVLAGAGREKAEEFFFGERDRGVPYLNPPEDSNAYGASDYSAINLRDRVRDLFAVRESPILSRAFDQMTGPFSAQALRAFIFRVASRGVAASEEFFRVRGEEWEAFPEHRWAIMEEFLVDAHMAEALALEKIDSESIALPEAEDGTVAVTLEIPSLRYDPSWYDADRLVSRPSIDDDKDYRLPPELVRVENLPRHAPQDVRALYRAMVAGNRDAMRPLIEKMAGFGEVPPEKFAWIADALEGVVRMWAFGETDAETVALRERIRNVEALAPLPASASSFAVHHRLLGRDRTIPSFVDSLRSGYLTEAALAHAVQLSRTGSARTVEVSEQMIVVETQARAMYRNVVARGVPVFRDFIQWLDAESRAAGPDYAGEFYVGRDTQSTLYRAAHALRWGAMTGERRRSLTVHVDVSARLLGSVPYDPEFREIMRTWLLQERVSEHMMGIDGGLIGHSPAGVFEVLSGHQSEEALDARIRLVDTKIQERRFNRNRSYDGIYDWLETVPKFTDRSRTLAQNEFGKYYVVSERRSPTERALAWTVQQAVWRELVNDDLAANAESSQSPLHEFGPYVEEDTEEVPDGIQA